MLINELRERLDFHDDFVEASEVRFVNLLENPSLVADLQLGFWNEWQSTQTQLDFQTLLIDQFEKSAALVVVDLKTGSNDGVRFILVNDLRHARPFVALSDS